MRQENILCGSRTFEVRCGDERVVHMLLHQFYATENQATDIKFTKNSKPVSTVDARDVEKSFTVTQRIPSHTKSRIPDSKNIISNKRWLSLFNGGAFTFE